MGRATIRVPATDNCKEVFETGLSDQMAMSYGTAFAQTLSEPDGYVTVTLSSGSVRVIGHDTLRGRITIGRLHPNYRTYLQLQKGR
jgi:ribosomal protein L2